MGSQCVAIASVDNKANRWFWVKAEVVSRSRIVIEEVALLLGGVAGGRVTCMMWPSSKISIYPRSFGRAVSKASSHGWTWKIWKQA